MVKSTYDKLTPYLGLVIVLFFLVTFIFYVYHEYTTPDKSKEITFKVVGIVNNTNATTLVSVQFECIKYCGTSVSSDYGNKELCWEQCANLGTGGCK